MTSVIASTLDIMNRVFNKDEVEESLDELLTMVSYGGVTRGFQDMKASRGFKGRIPQRKMTNKDWAMIKSSSKKRWATKDSDRARIRANTPPTQIKFSNDPEVWRWIRKSVLNSPKDISLMELKIFWYARKLVGRDHYENPEALVASFEMIGEQIINEKSIA